MTRIFIAVLIIHSSAACLGQKQGVSGSVLWIGGNQMPGPEKVNQRNGVVREIYFFKPVKAAEQNRTFANGLYQTITGNLVAKVKSDKAGNFKVKLRPGKYSVFTREKEGFFANRLDADGFLNIVEVRKNAFTNLVMEINYQASY